MKIPKDDPNWTAINLYAYIVVPYSPDRGNIYIYPYPVSDKTIMDSPYYVIWDDFSVIYYSEDAMKTAGIRLDDFEKHPSYNYENETSILSFKTKFTTFHQCSEVVLKHLMENYENT